MIKESFDNLCVEDVGNRGLMASLRTALFIADVVYWDEGSICQSSLSLHVSPLFPSLSKSPSCPPLPSSCPPLPNPHVVHLESRLPSFLDTRTHNRTYSHSSAFPKQDQVCLTHTSSINHHTVCKRRGLLLALPKCVDSPGSPCTFQSMSTFWRYT